jgi:hypothetical protein
MLGLTEYVERHAVAYVNLHMDRTGPQVVGAAYGTRAKADEMAALYGRTHLLVVFDDGSTITTA